MATEIGVSYASYRPWENGRDDHAGPTRLQAEQLDRALRRLLRSRYMEGEAFDAWGWPRQRDMSYDQVVELLRLAGFDVPRLQANGRPPAGVIWVHRGREANLVHGVFSLAAAAATRAGLPVHLLLDDLSMNDRRSHDLCDELESRIPRLGDRRSAAEARRQRPGRQPDRRSGYRRLQDRFHAVGL